MAKLNPEQRYDASYIRELIERAGHNPATAAEALGLGERTMRRYVSLEKGVYRKPPYIVIFALEHLPKRR